VLVCMYVGGYPRYVVCKVVSRPTYPATEAEVSSQWSHQHGLQDDDGGVGRERYEHFIFKQGRHLDLNHKDRHFTDSVCYSFYYYYFILFVRDKYRETLTVAEAVTVVLYPTRVYSRS